MTIDRATVESEDDGFHLVLAHEEGTTRFRLPTEVGMELDEQLRHVRDHHREGERERAAYDAATDEERAEVIGPSYREGLGMRRQGRWSNDEVRR